MRLHFEKFLDETDDINIMKLFEDKQTKKEFVEIFYNAVIQPEFEMFLGYKKYERTDLEKVNYRNGSHTKKFTTTDGEINLTIPHDRNSEFYPESVPKHKRRNEMIASAVVELFALGNSNSEVVKFCDNVFGKQYSRQTTSNIVEALDEVVDEFNRRRISKHYFALFMDATYIPIKFNSQYNKQSVYLVVGITEDGYQEILGYSIGFSENKDMWQELLLDLKARGLETVDVVCMDGAPRVPDVVKHCFPMVEIQICTFHMMRNLSSKLRKIDRAEVIGYIKDLYLLTDIKLIEKQFNEIINMFPQYERQLTYHFNREYQFTFLKFPRCIHRLIRTTN